jgi:AcrR family transcriptional regulator
MYAKSAATITDILNSAEALFLGKNYADITVDEVAAAAGVTKGAIYHHFGSKESLYVTMMDSALREKKELFQAAVLSPGTCRERLRKLTEIFLHLPREKRDLMKLVRRDINIFKYPIRDQLVRAYQSALPEQIEIIVRDGIQNGELAPADPRLLSWLYVANVEVILTPYAERIFEDHNEILDFVIHLFFEGGDSAYNDIDSKG